MERILKNERRVEGDCKRYLLRYTLVSNGFPKEEGEGIYYGIITEQTIVYSEEKNMAIAIINDITREEEMKKAVHRRKLDSVEMAQKVIDKQMVVAQQIASLLGETTAETKVTLNKLKDLIDSEVD